MKVLVNSHLVFDDEIIDSSLISQKQQEIYDKYISKHSYQFLGKNSLGASVEYDHIQSALYDVLKEQDKCEIIDNDSIRYIRPAKTLDDMSTIELESGRRFTTKLIIGNDGEDSYTREVHNIEATSHSYNQKWIVRTMIHSHPLQGAFQKFLPTGPIALMPMWNNYSQLIWSVNDELAQELLDLNDQEFIDEVNDVFYKPSKYQFGGFINRVAPDWIKNDSFELPPPVMNSNESGQFRPLSYSLTSKSATNHAAVRVALLGDAAIRLHPVTGQGFNLQMTAAAYLANNILTQTKSGGDIGDYQYSLKHFSNRSKLNELEVRAIMEVFKKGYQDTFFGSESIGKALSFVRNAGIDIMDTSPSFKYNMAFFAAGCTNHPLSYEWNSEY